MRKKRLIVLSVTILATAAVCVFLFSRDSGPPVEVVGNFTPREIAEIKAAARHELWREVFPGWSWSSLAGLPDRLKWAMSSRVVRIDAMSMSRLSMPDLAGKTTYTFAPRSNNFVFPVTVTLARSGRSNGVIKSTLLYETKDGWTHAAGVQAGWTSYSPLTTPAQKK